VKFYQATSPSRLAISLVTCLGLSACGGSSDGSATSSTTPPPARLCAVTLPAGTIADKYAKLGGSNGILGCPKVAPARLAGVQGELAAFEGGALVYRADRREAFLVTGKILDKWLEAGGAAGSLGMPKSDETDTSFLRGRLCYFDNAKLTYAWGSDEAVVHTSTPGVRWP
jgi:hypothetical protein